MQPLVINVFKIKSRKLFSNDRSRFMRYIKTHNNFETDIYDNLTSFILNSFI